MDHILLSDAIQFIAKVAFIAQLGVLAFSDATTLRLPFRANILFCFSGLVLGGAAFQTGPVDRLAGTIAGFMALSLIALLYRLIRRRRGLGGGDPILLAGIGAWYGWQPLPTVVLLSSMLGLLVVPFKHSFRSGSQSSSLSALRLPLGTLMSVSSAILLACGYI